MNSICTRIKELRKQLGMSQIEFAKNIGVTNSHISKIEKGETTPSASLIKLISREYQVSENWLETGEGSIFIFEVEEDVEKQLEDTYESYRKLLNSDSPALRQIARETKTCFYNIIDVDYLSYEQKMEYLNVVKKMFFIINQYNLIIKEHIYTGQMALYDIMENNFENYRADIENCLNEYKRLLNKSI